mmetsp:Transcript_23238/g.72368  ORF Transcript_23238/g.72368 Transcript_23238/m.72368 type:complete len:323 (+) Transcript_23238:180-1148(+)
MSAYNYEATPGPSTSSATVSHGKSSSFPSSNWQVNVRSSYVRTTFAHWPSLKSFTSLRPFSASPWNRENDSRKSSSSAKSLTHPSSTGSTRRATGSSSSSSSSATDSCACTDSQGKSSLAPSSNLHVTVRSLYTRTTNARPPRRASFVSLTPFSSSPGKRAKENSSACRSSSSRTAPRLTLRTRKGGISSTLSCSCTASKGKSSIAPSSNTQLTVWSAYTRTARAAWSTRRSFASLHPLSASSGKRRKERSNRHRSDNRRTRPWRTGLTNMTGSGSNRARQTGQVLLRFRIHPSKQSWWKACSHPVATEVRRERGIKQMGQS